MNKYYVIKTTKDGVQFKKYKCIDGWTKNRNECWEFSKQGAEKIANRLNEQNKEPHKTHYNTVEVERLNEAEA